MDVDSSVVTFSIQTWGEGGRGIETESFVKGSYLSQTISSFENFYNKFKNWIKMTSTNWNDVSVPLCEKPRVAAIV